MSTVNEYLKLLDEKAKEVYSDMPVCEGTLFEGLEQFINEYRFYSEYIKAGVSALRLEINELKERLRWKFLSNEQPDLNQDVEIWAMHCIILQGHFFDYEDGNDASPDIRFNDSDLGETFTLDEMPSECYWRYLYTPEDEI